MVQLDELAERDCDQMIARLNGGHCLDNIEFHCWQLDGEVSEGFGDFVREHNIDLLIVGTRGRSGISKLLLGSVAEEIFHCVCCPVLTIGPWSRPAARQLKLNRVLFATDLSAESFSAISYVLTAAKTWQADIDVLHVCSPVTSKCQGSMESLSRTMDSFTRGEGEVAVRYHIQPGTPSATVLNFARQNNEDLIVLGLDRHRSLYSGPPLSHAYEIVRQSKCPVLSVRS
jgi:nucleotide-binding universal stress UspA family protein